jgi:hypothetical protein
VEQFNEDTTIEYFLANKRNFIYTADKVPTGEEMIHLLNESTLTMDFEINESGKGVVDGMEFDIETMLFKQNNEHHLEDENGYHVCLMQTALRFHGAELLAPDYEVLERAIFWSDIGKLATAKPSPKKTWEDGTPQTTAYGHAAKSVEILDEAVSKLNAPPLGYESVRWLVAEHMNAHQLKDKEAQGKTEIPNFLVPQIEGLEPWNYPEYEDLVIPHGVSFSKKKHYNWIKRNHKLLIIKQKCDEDGRISDLSF